MKISLTDFAKACGFVPQPYQRQLLDAFERGETPHAMTWDEQRAAQREARRKAIADFYKFLGR
jgi:hypothetical protein